MKAYKDTTNNDKIEKTVVIESVSRLVIISGERNGSKIEINKDNISIGSAEDNDVCFYNNPMISGHHVRIYKKNINWRLKNVSGAEPVIVDGIALSDAILSNGSIIEIGDIKLRYEEELSNLLWKLKLKNNRKKYFSFTTAVMFAIAAVLSVYWLNKNNIPEISEYTTKNSGVQEGSVSESSGIIKFNNAETLYIQGMGKYNKGYFKEAAGYWLKALQFNPDYTEVKEHISLLSRKLEKNKNIKNGSDEIIEKKYIEKNERNTPDKKRHKTAELNYRKGRVFYDNNEIEKALYYWGKVIKIIDDPEDSLYKQTIDKINKIDKGSKK